jgi:hypothetical protein
MVGSATVIQLQYTKDRAGKLEGSVWELKYFRVAESLLSRSEAACPQAEKGLAQQST